MKQVIAIDLGASNGRLMKVKLKNKKITIKEIHRFSNQPIEIDGFLHWDIDMIFYEIKEGLKKVGERISSIGVDTWGVDIGFVSKEGALIEHPFSYRDTHSSEVMDEIHQKVDEQTLFKRTGVISASINSLYQLKSILSRNPEWVHQTQSILTMPNVINFLMTGKEKNEFTHASTTQLLNYKTKDWDEDLLEKVFDTNLPLAPLHPTNSLYGMTTEELNQEVGIDETPVIQVPGHDTACAVAAMPYEGNNTAFMSCGTWVLMGIKVSEPIVSKEAYELGFTNEGTVEQEHRLQVNNMGLWILQQCKQEWAEQGHKITYEMEEELMNQSEPLQSFIDPDDETFFNPESMVGAIREYCKRTHQQVPETKGDIIRTIIESLALKYRWVIERLEQLTNKEIPFIHMAGGGIQNKHFCQFTANATMREIKAGPIEASSLGNALSQLIAIGELKDWEEAREVMKNSFPLTSYSPERNDAWDEAYERFKLLL